MRPKTNNTKLLQSVTEVYYKVRRVFQSASGITKCDGLLLQSASGITNCDSYYKVRRNSCHSEFLVEIIFQLTLFCL